MKNRRSAFTLIELSIVLVIIGLVIGGVLVGKDLIKAAEIRSLISQIDSFKLATNTFKEKYGQLPGDMQPAKAAQFGFFTFTGPYAGTLGGNNDGMVAGGAETPCIWECGAFWRHLSDAGLVQGSYGQTLEADTDTNNIASPYFPGTPAGEIVNTHLTLSKYMPTAKGGSGYLGAGVVKSSYMAWDSNIGEPRPGPFDRLENVFFINQLADYEYSGPSISSLDGFIIDSKIDDGKPNTGKFTVSSYNVVVWTSYWSDGTLDSDSNPLSINSKACTIGGADAYQLDVRYNTDPATGANNITCYPMFVW